jgi:NTP pyrophosphatase (non-canonical NTP hydrolase)
MKMQFEELREKIVQWANGWGLIEGTTTEKQAMKLGEEYGEVLREVLKDDPEKLYVEIGDMMVVIINMCAKLNIKPEACLSMAYNKIKDRNGKMQNGTFQKSDDLGDRLNTKQMHSMSEYFRIKAGMPKDFDVWRDATMTETSAADKNPFGLGK